MRLAAAFASALALFGCGGEARPHLVLIVVDTLRADHLGAYGYERPTSPHIDGLAARGFLFENASAPSSWTRPSVASLFTSREPAEHGAVSLARPLDAAIPTLAEELRDAGYRTVGVSGNFVHVNEEMGFARGFETWRTLGEVADAPDADVLFHMPLGEETFPLRAPTASEVTREVLENLPPADGLPVFLYVHYMEPHAGYLPPERLRAVFARDPAAHDGRPRATSDHVVDIASGRAEADAAERERLIDLYDAEIAAVDAAVGELLDALDERGFGRDLVVVVASDHGEEFGDHGGWFHGVTLHRELLAVPLVIRDFRSETGGARIDAPVDLLDVPTTLLALAGVEPDPEMRGRALLDGDELAPRDLVAQLDPNPRFERHVRPRAHRAAVTRWPWKAIVPSDADPLVYRLDRDPAERTPLADVSDAPADLVATAMRVANAIPEADDAELDPSALEGLRALGYVE